MNQPSLLPDQERGLLSPGFLGLLISQALGATNDNIFRWLVIGIAKAYMPEDEGLVLSLGTACFVLPFLLIAAPAGYLADRFSKRQVIIGCKAAEVVIMAAGVAAIWFGSLEMLMVIVALMGTQSALLGPSKLGSVPEILPANKISAANGLMGLTTVGSTVIGMAIGNMLATQTAPYGQHHLHLSAIVLLGVAAFGLLTSLLIQRIPAANPTRTFPYDAPRQTVRDLRLLFKNRGLLRVALGIAFFWSIGAMAQLNIDQFAFEGGAWEEDQKNALLISLVSGIGVGSVLAGLWSAGRVELGIVPLGAFGVALFSALLFTVKNDILINTASTTIPIWTGSYVWACVFLALLGMSAGLFSVPLAAYLQHHSPSENRGSIMAASNFMTFTGILTFVGMFYLVRLSPEAGGDPFLSAREVFLLCGFITLPVFLYVVLLLPQALIRFLVWLASKTVYRIRIDGLENLPERGGALLVPNHVSWLDGVLLLLASSRPVRVIALAENFNHPLLTKLADIFGGILITTNPKSIARGLKTARQALKDGELVCIFAEGGMTRSGQIQGFKPGMVKVLKGTDVPVVPVYLDELWGSIFTYSGGRLMGKWSRRWRKPISIHFGKPIEHHEDTHLVRQALQEVGAQAVMRRKERVMNITRETVRALKRRKRSTKIADSTGAELSGGMTLMRTLILRRLLRREVLENNERYVGLLLPPSVGGTVANLALTFDRRVPVNLNYTVTSEVLNHCIKKTGIRHVLTSRKFMEKMNFDLDAEVVYLEDFRDKVTLLDKATTAFQALALPAALLERQLRLTEIQPDDEMTIIFTSGSTGTPKGVMLTYANIAHNKEAIDQVIHLSGKDALLGVLPFFHSMGFTVTLWTTIALDVKTAYHYNPLEAKVIGKLAKKHATTVLLATPTFLRSYIRRCSPEQFAALDTVVTGAEKLPRDVRDAFEEKFGVQPVEGYGVTELSPLVSVNVPPSRSANNFQSDCKAGTVGRTVSGVSTQITDLDTGEVLPVGQPGMLWVKGPNVMKGYFGEPEKTGEVIRDGWYKTGDIALIDNEGFLTITGRLSRFSKIGGEMVPHLQIEETLDEILGSEEEQSLQAVVTAVPDPRKGERLIVVHTAISQTPQQLCTALQEKGLPNLFIPSPDSFLEVAEIPILGTGKLDLKGIQEVALAHFGTPAADS